MTGNGKECKSMGVPIWKRIAVCVTGLLALLLTPVTAMAEGDTFSDYYQEQLDASGAQEILDNLPADTKVLLENLGIDGLDEKSLTALQPQNTLQGLLDMLAGESKGVLASCGILLGIILVCAFMDSMRQTVKEAAMSEVFSVICALAACAAVLIPITKCIHRVSEAAESTSVFMMSFVPVYSGILLTSGQAVTAVSYQTVVLFVAELIAALSTYVIVPLMTVSLALGLTGSVSPGMKLDGASNLINKSAGWLLGLTTTLFVGLLSLQGIVGAAADTLAGKALKFSIASFVPVVGGSLSEALNTVKGCLSLLKSTVGGFGILATALIVLPPILECIVWTMGLSVCSMASDMFGLGQISGVLKAAQTVVKTLIGVLAACSLFMIVATTIVTKMGTGAG